jgi:hypothetical protein
LVLVLSSRIIAYPKECIFGWRMSNNWMIVIPLDPLAVPPKERAEAALALLTAMRPASEDPGLYLSDKPELFLCGANFHNVFCPFCGMDIQDWWKEPINAWSESADRRDLSVKTPCCGRATTLNDLDYDWPQGFACCAISLMNPEADLEPEERLKIEAALGLPVRVIWEHL